jgi:hypothetical protein
VIHVGEAKKKRSYRSLVGLSIILLAYVALSIIASTFYPQGFSPMTNTLGNLGNPKLNPSGAMFYNAGMLIVSGATGVTAILLLILPKQWLNPRSGGKRRTFFYLSTFCMLGFSFFLALTALFPAGAYDATNTLFTLIFLVWLELFIVFSSIGITRLKDHYRLLPTFGFAIAIADIFLVVASKVNGYPIFSWALSLMTWPYMIAVIYEFSNMR